jgi:nucleoside-diphosphate-sugar epimerase
LSGKRALVTGARGFIGSHLCERLLSEGAEVHAVSRSPVKGTPRGPLWHQSDLLDVDVLRGLLKKVRPDLVFHLSGQVSAAPQIENVLPAFHSLLASTVNLLTISTELGCGRVVLTGSLTEPQPGRTDAAPGSPYGAAKWAAVAFGRMFHSLYAAPVVITRPYMVYGPRQHPSKIIPYTITSLAKGIAPRLASGTWAADWVYISDVIEGMVRAATAPDVEGCTIEFGSGELTAIKDVVRRIVATMGTPVEPVFGALPDRPTEEVHVADVAYARAKLGWQPTVSLGEGIAATVRAFRDQAGAADRRPAAAAS